MDDDLKACVMQVLDFWAEGKPPGWPDNCAWPDSSLNADWVKALYPRVYSEDDLRLAGDTPFMVSGRVLSHGSSEYVRILHELIAEGRLEVIVDAEALSGHRFEYHGKE